MSLGYDNDYVHEAAISQNQTNVGQQNTVTVKKLTQEEPRTTELPEKEPDETDADTNEDPLDEEDPPKFDTEDEEDAFRRPERVRPLWMLFCGKLMWATSYYGFEVKEREWLRRRVQAYLDLFGKYFPEKNDEQKLALLEGFFIRGVSEQEQENQQKQLDKSPQQAEKNKGKKSTNWTNRLGRVGIVCGTQKISLGSLFADQGQKPNGLPGLLLGAWLDEEIRKDPSIKERIIDQRRGESKTAISTLCIDELHKRLLEFCAEIETIGASVPAKGITPYKCAYTRNSFGNIISAYLEARGLKEPKRRKEKNQSPERVRKAQPEKPQTPKEAQV